MNLTEERVRYLLEKLSQVLDSLDAESEVYLRILRRVVPPGGESFLEITSPLLGKSLSLLGENPSEFLKDYFRMLRIYRSVFTSVDAVESSDIDASSGNGLSEESSGQAMQAALIRNPGERRDDISSRIFSYENLEHELHERLGSIPGNDAEEARIVIGLSSFIKQFLKE